MTNLHTVTPVTHDLGGFQVRRAVPSPECRMVGPFVFVDQFGPARLAASRGRAGPVGVFASSVEFVGAHSANNGDRRAR